MKLNYKLLIILFVAVIFLQAVSAEDVNETISNATDSFSDFQEIVNKTQENHEIDVKKDYTYHDGDSQITIDKSVVINGNNHTFDAKNKSAIFNIKADNVVIKNLNFINANAGKGESVMHHVFYYNVVVDDSGCFKNYNDIVFENYDSSSGGAVYCQANNILITDCQFENNYAGVGGAVYSRGENLTINNSIFVKNQAFNGAAVYIKNNTSIIDNSRFFNNTASNFGSGVYLNKGKIKIKNSTFNDNVASLNSSLYFSGEWQYMGLNSSYYHSFVDFSRCNVKLNVYNLYNDSYELIIRFPDRLFLINDVVNKSFSVNINGNVYNLKAGADKKSFMQFNSTVSNFNITLFNPITFTNYSTSGSFLNNSFYALQRLIDSNCEINLTQDYFFTDFDEEILIFNKSVVINGNGHIIDAKHKSRIFNIQNADVIIKNITLMNGECNPSTVYSIFSSSNEGIQAIYGSMNADDVCYDSNKFRDNSKQYYAIYYYGGALYSSNSDLQIVDSTFINNHASAGGAMSISEGTSLIYNSTFINNSGLIAGAIYNNANLTVYNSIFNLNSAKYSGSSIYSAKDINIQKCQFSNNSDKDVLFTNGNWQVDDMNSAYYNSFVKFAFLNFEYELKHVEGSCYNLKIMFCPSTYTVSISGYSYNRKFSLDVNGNVYNLTTNNNGEASINLNITGGLAYITVFNPITKACLTKNVNLLSNEESQKTDSTNPNKVSKDKIKSYKITAKKNTKIKNSFKIKITVKKASGKSLKVKFNKKTYKIKLNKKGVGYFKLSNNVLKTLEKSKKYSYKITYKTSSVKKYFTLI